MSAYSLPGTIVSALSLYIYIDRELIYTYNNIYINYNNNTIIYINSQQIKCLRHRKVK